MLRNTFVHLPGIGPHRERAIWEQGILDWDGFLRGVENGTLSRDLHRAAAPVVRQSQKALAEGDAGFFSQLLPGREMWRLYPEFADRALFLDIETTGLSRDYHEVTVIGALGGGQLALFVGGVNLDQFPDYIRRFPLLVTFNGSLFDVPFLQAHFPDAQLDQAHIDLRFALASLGYRGGLKAVERRLGLRRDPSIQGTDGFEAVWLWRRHRRGDRDALRKLLLYNLTDVVNMVELVETTVRLKQPRLAFPGAVGVSGRSCPRTPELGELAEWIERSLALWGMA